MEDIDTLKNELDKQKFENANLKNDLEKRRNEDAKIMAELRKENENLKKEINTSNRQKELYYIQLGELVKEINQMKEDIKKINNNNNPNNNDLALRINDNNNNQNKEQIMIKFEKDKIKHDISIKKARNLFKIENIKITNIGNKKFENLFFVIDTKNSSKNLSFYQGNNTYKLSLNRTFSKGQNLNNNFNLFIKNPVIGEYNIFIYVREKPDGENLSSTLKITVNVIKIKKKSKYQ